MPTTAVKISLILSFFTLFACQTGSKNNINDTAIDQEVDTAIDQEVDTAIDQEVDTATIPDNDTSTEQDTSEDQNEPENPINFSIGCGSSTDDLGSSISIEGEARTFVLSLPENYDSQTAYPLVFAWHGRGGSGSVAKGYFGLQDIAGSEAIIVYPDGLPQEDYNGDTGWEVRASGSDIIFFDSLYERITENSCIDLDRVYSAGHSFGGFMTNFLGCKRANVLSAIASVAGGGPWGSCEGSIAAILIHGNNDNIVEISEGESSLSKWKVTNECLDSSTSSSDGHCISYDNCTHPVEWCEFSGGHMWPPFAAETIWNFFLSP